MIMLDTHAWIWWVTESCQLSDKAMEAIRRGDSLGVGIISCWEVAMPVAKQRIGFTMDVQDWIDTALERPKIGLVHLEPETVVLSTRLPGRFGGDPADQLIVATCRSRGMPLATEERRMFQSGQIPSFGDRNSTGIAGQA